jgi:hypothetical protein
MADMNDTTQPEAPCMLCGAKRVRPRTRWVGEASIGQSFAHQEAVIEWWCAKCGQEQPVDYEPIPRA